LTQCWIETNIQKSHGVGRGFGVSNLSPLTGRRVGPSNQKFSVCPCNCEIVNAQSSKVDHLSGKDDECFHVGRLEVAATVDVMTRDHSFPRKILPNSAAPFAKFRGSPRKILGIPRLTAAAHFTVTVPTLTHL